MELEFLGPGAIVGRLLVAVPAGLVGDGRRSWARASSSGAGSASTGGSSTARSAWSASALVLFWLLTAIFADQVALFDPYAQLRALQNKPPGVDRRRRPACPTCSAATRWGATCSAAWSTAAASVMVIAPLATLFAYMVGITLGPAGGLLRRLARHGAVLPRQPGARLPGDPAVLPAGDARDPRDARSPARWRRCCSSSR